MATTIIVTTIILALGLINIDIKIKAHKYKSMLDSCLKNRRADNTGNDRDLLGALLDIALYFSKDATDEQEKEVGKIFKMYGIRVEDYEVDK